MGRFKETNERLARVKRYLTKEMLKLGYFPWLQALLDNDIYILSSVQNDLLKIDKIIDKEKNNEN